MARGPEASRPKIIAIGSPCGGAGRTTLTAELAKALARRNVQTVLVDCALLEPMIPAALGRSDEHGDVGPLCEGAHLVDFVQRPKRNAVASLLLGPGVDPSAPLPDPVRLMERLRRLDDQLVILDLPPGAQPFWTDLFALSDIPLTICSPEAWSIRQLLPYLRFANRRADAHGHGRLRRSYLILNRCRDASERELGEVLCHVIWRKVGQYPRFLGPIDHDDRRWFHLRHGAVGTPLSSAQGMGVQIEEIAKRLLALDDFNETRPRTGTVQVAPSGANWMGLSENAAAPDLRAQYRRLWEGYRRESAVSQVMLEDEERAALITELERTYRALQMQMDGTRPTPMPVARGVQPLVKLSPSPAADPKATATAAQEVTAAGAPQLAVAKDEPAPDRAGASEQAPSQTISRTTAAQTSTEGEEPSPEKSESDLSAAASGEPTGDRIRQAREAKGMSLREISLRTKINLRYLRSIESMEASELPQPVYLRGYLREIARILDLEADSVLTEYLGQLESPKES